MTDNMEGTGLRVRPLPHLITTVSELRAAVDYLLRYDTFVIDVETTFDGAHANTVLWIGLGGPGRVYLIPIQHPLGLMLEPARTIKELPPEEERKTLASGKLSNAKRTVKLPPVYAEPPDQLFPSEVFNTISPLLFSDRGKVGHNVKFDLLSIAKYYGGVIPPGPYHDTLVNIHLLDENKYSYELKPMVMDWLRVPKAQRESFYPNLGRKGVQLFPIDEAAMYLAKDIRYTWMLWRSQHPQLKKQGLSQAYELEMALYGVLMRVEKAGFAVDTRMLKEVGDKLAEEIRAIEGAVWAIAGFQFDLTLTAIKRELLFNPKKPKDGSRPGQGLKPLSLTPKDKLPQLNKATLEFYAGENQLAELFLEWSSLEKLHGTFITGLSNFLINGRIHTSFKQHGTVTGRLSAHEPNLQQIPARGRGTIIRELFVAGPGNALVVADYDQIELRCAAYLSEDPEMMRVFLEGQDIHSAAAASMYAKAISEVTKEERQVGKGQNFLTLYGGGAKKLARTAKVDVNTAQRFIDRYYRQFAGLKAWKEKIVKDARARGDRGNPFSKPPYVLIPPTNRRRRLLDLYSPDEYERYRGERQAVNAVVQGFASNIMKQALIDLDEQLGQYNAVMLGTVHDEIIVECEERYAEPVKDLVAQIMGGVTFQGQPILGTVPLVASAAIGKSWAEAKG
jgi:DNA polymerase I-like protein with 3'-5' exonuclease and polymerase domains